MGPSSSTSPDAPCRQPKPGADRSGPAEGLRILNRGRKRGRSHGADARHRHQDLACLAPAGAGDALPSKLCLIALIQESLAVATRVGAAKPADFQQVIIDT